MATLTLSEKRAQAGQLGGLATVRAHGRDHMREIGRRGGEAFWSRYRLAPVAQASFAIVERATGRIVALTQWNGGSP